ncbi:MAG: NAD-dependent epimerase/dehydratase family protein, partial [Sphingobacteriales bacterium]
YSYFSSLPDKYECKACDVAVDYSDSNYFQIDATNSDFTDIFEQAGFDVCINCSGAASVPDSIIHPLRDFTLNVFNVVKILDAIKRHAPHCKFINLSSAAVYGNPQRLPIAETDFCNPVSPYGTHKQMAEQVCKEYAHYFGLKTCSARIFSAYGPGLKKQLLWDICQKAKQSDTVNLFGTGNESRDFIYVADIVQTLRLLISEASFTGDIFNIANGIEITVRELAETILHQLNYNGKLIFTKMVGSKNRLNFGLDAKLYKVKPGNLKPLSAESLYTPVDIEHEQALESAVFLSDKIDVTKKLSLDLGLRYSFYNYLGPKNVNIYADGLPRNEFNLIRTESYGSGKSVQAYNMPEIRASARYSILDNLSVKASYNTLAQYMHLLSNTTTVTPTDVWKLSDNNIKPQKGSQISFGIYQNASKNTIEISAEVYYKKIKDYLDYKSGAQIILNKTIETEVLKTEGKAYGAEFMIKKNSGRFNGWFSYTFSRTFLKTNDPVGGELINKGEFYPSNYDKPHDMTLVGNYRFSERFSFSLNGTYSTGRPITLPIGKYTSMGSERVLYSDRNEYRVPDYFRLDISFNLDGNYKLKQKTHNSWNFGLYNVTGRDNAYSVFYNQENGRIKGYKLTIFANPVPFVNYNIRF